MADNNDFAKITGQFCMGPSDTRAGAFQYFESNYVRAQRFCWESEIPSSEIIPVSIASQLEKTFSNGGRFDIRWLGAVHASIFLVFYFLLLRMLRPLYGTRWLVTALAALWIFADVAFVAYFNSFFTDAAALLGAMIAVVMAVQLLRPAKIDTISLILFTLGALLFVTSKTQHSFWGFVPAGCSIVAALKACNVKIRVFALMSAACILCGVLWIQLLTPAWYPGQPRFSLIFFQIAKNSSTPLQDLRELGLNASDLPYVGMHAYSEKSPAADDRWMADFRERTGYAKIVAFYFHHPGRMLAILKGVLVEDAWVRRPMYLTNFQRQEGKPVWGSLTSRFGSWSEVRILTFHRWPMHIPIWYGLAVCGSAVLVFLSKGLKRVLAGVLFSVALAGAGEFLFAALADACETQRHLLIFHLLTDFTFFLTLVFLCTIRMPSRKACSADRSPVEAISASSTQ